MSINVRHEKLSDTESIELVIIEAFCDVPHSDQSEHHIVRALRAAGVLTLSLVAEDQGMIIGHVAISPVSISGGASEWYGLGPISVLPAYQNNGVGSELMRQIMNELKLIKASGCVLLGDPNYYGRFGFRSVPDLTLPGVPAEYFQAISISGTLPKGEVAYHDAFYVKS